MRTPKRTRLALLPVMGTTACWPRKAHTLRRGGNQRKMVSSSKRTTARGGLCFRCRTIAPLFGPDGDPWWRRRNAVASTAAPIVSCGDGAWHPRWDNGTCGAGGRPTGGPSNPWYCIPNPGDPFGVRSRSFRRSVVGRLGDDRNGPHHAVRRVGACVSTAGPNCKPPSGVWPCCVPLRAQTSLGLPTGRLGAGGTCGRLRCAARPRSGDACPRVQNHGALLGVLFP